MVTSAAAFGAALNYFNLWVVFFISLASSLAADVVHYAIGFLGRRGLIERFGKYVGLTKERINLFDELAHQNAGKAILLSKLIPMFATPGLIIAGMTHMPLKKYMWWAFVVTAPTSLVFLIVGYYFGAAYVTFERYLNLGGYLAVGILLISASIYYINKKLSRKLMNRI